jgi:Predicted phosphoglycerate mutase, AP superfamily
LDEKDLIVDRRAGRNRYGINELALSISRQNINNVRFDVAAGKEHRIALIMRGSGLQDCISGIDPGDNCHSGTNTRLIKPINKNNRKCLRSAELLYIFELKVRKILAKHPVNLKRVSKNLLPANSILTREPGQSHYFPKIKQHSGE